MKLHGVVRVAMCLLVVAGGIMTSVVAQTPPQDTIPPITTGLPYENVANVGARSPGNMVAAGVARAQDAVILPRAQVTVDQTADADVDLIDGLIAGAVEIILNQLEELLFYFTNLFLERIGLPPIDPGDFDNNDNDNDNQNGNANDNENDNDNDNDNANTNDNDNDNENDNSNTNNNLNGNTNTNTNDNTRPGGVRKGRASQG